MEEEKKLFCVKCGKTDKLKIIILSETHVRVECGHCGKTLDINNSTGKSWF